MHRTLTVSAYLVLSLISMLSGSVLSSQETSSSPHWTNSVPDAPSAVKTTASSETGFHFPFRRFALSSERDASLATSSALRSNSNVALKREGQIAKGFDYGKSVFGLNPGKEMLLPTSNAAISGHTVRSSDELERYIHHIPLAGPMLLRVSQEPHLTRVLRVVQPRF